MSKFVALNRVARGLMLMLVGAAAAEAGVVRPIAESVNRLPNDLAPQPLVKLQAAQLDLVSLPVLYQPATRHLDATRVLPDSLTAPASLMPAGTLAWAGIREAATLVEVQQSAPKQPARRAEMRDVAADATPNVELLTAIPAPEPPAVMLAGVAVVAGGMVLSRTRRRSVDA